MPHIPESEFADLVELYLEHKFAPEDVAREEVLPSNRRPDFVVRSPFVVYAVEVENEAGATYNSVGQALAYASELSDISDGRRVDPVVVVPDHVDEDVSREHLTEEIEYLALSTSWTRP